MSKKLSPPAAADTDHFQPDPDEVDRAFQAGNYAQVARWGRQDRWQTFAALGLIGLMEPALAGLERFSGEQARFHEAVALFIGGREREAVLRLEKLHLPHARQLSALIRKPRIRVLGQLPWVRSGPSDFLSSLEKNPRFEIINVSFASGDTRNQPYADVTTFFDRRHPPDLYLCKMVEWHYLPPNLQELPCPILGHTGDYDMHIQALQPWLHLFDELVVCDQSEWRAVGGLTPVKVSTFPKAFGVPGDLPPAPRQPRGIDVFQSGTLNNLYLTDKMGPLFQALSMPVERNVVVINGFISSENYFQLLGDSKSTWTYVRHPGAMPTRGLEALAMGCALAVQQKCTLSLFYGENEGVVTYGEGPGDLSAALERILGNWDRFEDRALRGAEAVRRDFGLERVTSEYMRFLMYLAARPRAARTRVETGKYRQKRMTMSRGWLPSPDLKVQSALRQASQERWLEEMGPEAGANLYNDLCRELVLEYAHSARLGELDSSIVRDEGLMARALSLYRRAVDRYPRHLVLRFNWMRAALHFGNPNEISEALRLAELTVATSADKWEISPEDDVFPWDFASDFFNYRAYLDLVCHCHQESGDHRREMVRLILASMYAYLGMYEPWAPLTAKAVQLDPAFAPYKKLEAIRLKRLGEQHLPAAVRLLTELATESNMFLDAALNLERLHNGGVCQIPDLMQIAAPARRALASELELSKKGIHVSPIDRLKPMRPLWGALIGTLDKRSAFFANPPRIPASHSVNHAPRGDGKVSLLMPTMDRPEFLERSLAYYLSAGFDGWILIGDSSTDERNLNANMDVVRRHSNRLHIVYRYLPKQHFCHDGTCVKEMIEWAPTPYLTMACDDDFLVPTGLSRCADFLDTNPAIPATSGHRLNMVLEGEGAHGRAMAMYAQDYGFFMRVDDQDPLTRWKTYLGIGLSTLYFVARKDLWRLMYRDAYRMNSRYLGPELGPCSVMSLAGPAQILDCISVVHQTHPNRILNFEQESLMALMSRPAGSSSLDILRFSLASTIKDMPGFSFRKASQMVDHELSRHFSTVMAGQYQEFLGNKQQPAHNALAVLTDEGSPCRRDLELILKVCRQQPRHADKSGPGPNGAKQAKVLSLPIGWTGNGQGPHPRRPEATPVAQLPSVQGSSLPSLKQGEELAKSGRYLEAERIFQEMLHNDPDQIEARNALAYVMWYSGRREQAVVEQRSVVERGGHNPDYVWNLGQYLDELGRRDEALALFKSFSESHPQERRFASMLQRWEANHA